MKTCKKCNIPKELGEFSKNNKTEDKLNAWCKLCLHNKYLKDKTKVDFIEKRNKNFQKHRENNPEYYKQKDLENYQNNIDLWKVKNQKYKSENKDKINKQLREKYKNNKVYRVKCLITSLIKFGFKNKGFKKKSRTYQIIGCTFEELKEHLEKQFEPWMNWDNQGLFNGELNYGWDIDHIIPISSAQTEEDVIRLNHYTNFQPLCSYVNRYVKVNKIIL